MVVNLTDKFIDEMCSLSKKKFSSETILMAKKCLLDYLGVTIAGARKNDLKISELLENINSLSGDISLIGLGKKTDVLNAAFINGMNSHFLELDDGCRYGAIHPGGPIISAILSIAEKEKISGTNILLGIIMGYEVAIRLAYSIQPSHYYKGYHPSATCGLVGSAMGISFALGFTKKQIKNTFSSSILSSSGTLKVLENDSDLKPSNIGRASLLGMMSVFLGKTNFCGPIDVLSGENGFMSMMADYYDERRLTQSNESLWINSVYFKKYSACRHAHAPIEASFRIRNSIGMNIDNISQITLRTYYGLIGKHDKKNVASVAAAKMSIPYCVAIALYTGKAGLDEFSLEYIKNKNVQAIMDKIEIIEDEDIAAKVPHVRSSVIELTTKDGKKFVERVDFPKGEPENPMNYIEVKNKFNTLLISCKILSSKAKSIVNIVDDLENKYSELYTQINMGYKQEKAKE